MGGGSIWVSTESEAPSFEGIEIAIEIFKNNIAAGYEGA